MVSISFNNKRDSLGRPITFESQELNYNLTITFLNKIKNYAKYKYLTNLIDEKLINIYLYKVIFDSLLPITNVILLDKEKSDKIKKIKLNPERFKLNKKIVCTIYNNFEKNYEIVVVNKLKTKIKEIIFSYKYIAHNNLFSKNKKLDNKIKKIALRARHGIDLKDSDLGWTNYSKNKKKNFLLYFESKSELNSLGGNNYLNYLNKNGYNYIILNKYEFAKSKKLKNLIKYFNSKIEGDDTDKFLSSISKELIKKIYFWRNFFLKNNIVLHEDSSPNNIENIIKYISLNLNGGISFSIQRSYPMNFKGVFASYFNSDYFFSWGIHSQKLFNKTFNVNKKFINTGINYNNLIKTHCFNHTKNFFANKDINYIIMLLDTNHDTNSRSIYDNFSINYQVISTEDLESFYLKFFDLIKNNQHIGLIIKSKKIEIFNQLKNVKQNLQNHPILKKNVYVIEDNKNFSLREFKNLIDLSVSISFYTPTIFIESIILGIRSICYDYSNIFKYEKEDFINKKFNMNNIFLNIDTLIKKISILYENYLNKKNDDLGIWDQDVVNQFDEFKDGKSYEKISNYLDRLYDNFSFSKYNNNKDLM